MDNDALMDKIKSLLDNPEAAKLLSGMLENSDTTENVPDESESQKPSSAQTASRIQSVLSEISGGNDPRINLLSALKPYMNSTRSEYVDRAIKIMKITKMTSIFKDLDL